MTADALRPRQEIVASFEPGFTDFTADFHAFFDHARAWGRANEDRLRAADEARGYSDEAIGAIERDLFGEALFWLQSLYFERGLHDLVARHLMERPLWDREYRDLPWTVESGSNKRPASSDGIPLEELREAVFRFEADGRGDLSVLVWLHVADVMLGRETDPKDMIDTFDLCCGVVERCGAAADVARVAALSERVPNWPD